MGCEIRRTLYIQCIIPCGYWGRKLSEWRWCWMWSIWHIHLYIWLHHCIDGVWICPELQILKQLSLDLVHATVEAETIVKILHDERADDNLYQALYDEAVELGAGVDVFPSKPRCGGRQMHRNNVVTDSQFHYWKFSLNNVFIDNIVEELENRFTVLKPTCTAQLSIPTNLHKIAANDQLIIKHAYEPYINGDAFYMECRRWKARWSGEQNPQAHWRPHWMPSCIQTSLSFWLFFWRFQWRLPLLKDLSAPWKE